MEPETFGLFVHWMYTQEISETTCTDRSLKESERYHQEVSSADQLIELWLREIGG